MGNNDDPQNLHKYAYGNLDPVNGSDPSGQWTTTELLVVTGIILNISGFLYRSFSAGRNFANNNPVEGAKDEAWAMIDLLFLWLPGSGAAGPTMELAGGLGKTAASMLQAGINPSAVWGYLTMSASVADASSGGGRGSSTGSGGGSSSNEPRDWAPETQKWSENAIKYQEQETGRRGWQYLVNKARFDGYDKVRNVLIDAKDNYLFTLKKDGTIQDWFNFRTKWIEKAQKQFDAAGGTPIEWHFSQEAVADAVRPLVSRWVRVVYAPRKF